jgi:hypothetical protein
MFESAGHYPLNLQVLAVHPPVRPPIAPVQAPAAGGGASGAETGGHAGGSDPRRGESSTRLSDPRLSTPPDRFTLTGPSPAFEASLLEAESGFRNVLARIEVARARIEAQRAFGKDPAPAVAAAPVAKNPPQPAEAAAAELPEPEPTAPHFGIVEAA